jgi:hypothetical protein
MKKLDEKLDGGGGRGKFQQHGWKESELLLLKPKPLRLKFLKKG